MNVFGKSITRKLGYSFGANLVSLIVSVFSVSFIPKYMSVDDYGLYQLFLFYFGYVGFLHFGVLGGAIVRFAGRQYFELDYAMMKTQCIILFAILCGLSVGLFFANVSTGIFDSTIFYLFLVSMFAQHIIWYSIAMLQMSNRLEDAAKLLLWERISWGIFGVGAVVFGYSAAFYVILAYAVTRIFAMLYSLYFIPEIVLAPVRLTITAWKEFKLNFSLGFPITLSDICSMLIMGIIRFSVSDVWDLSVFAKTSLALSFTFFFLTFITSASTVLLPALRQMQSDKSDAMYIPLNRLLSVLLLVALWGYFPLQEIILMWLPKYSDGMAFMGILFPAIFFESKFNLLVATYLKKLLKTKVMFFVNLFATFISLVGSLLFCYYLQNITLSIFIITWVLGIRYLIAEYILGGYIAVRVQLLRETCQALVIIGIFEYIVVYSCNLWGELVYIAVLVIFGLLSRKQIKQAWYHLKKVVTE